MKALELEICTGAGCCLLGSQDLMDAVAALPDEQRRLIRLSGPSCLDGCRKGPAVRIDGEVYSAMTPDKLIELVEAKTV